MEIQMEAPTPVAEDAASAPVSAMPSWLRWTGRIAAWLLTAVATVVVLGLVSVTVLPKFLPYQALVVRSGSMSPTIPTGSVVFYTKRAADKVKVGDIIVFDKPGSSNEKVTHRVFSIGTSSTGPYFRTKGDANGAPDDWQVPAVGTGWIAKFHVPVVGYALSDIQSSLGRILLLLIPAVLLGGITLYEIWHDRGRSSTA
jgi:signal peptidase